MMQTGKSSTGQPGKLQHSLNIDVFKLLPGARRPQAPVKRDIAHFPQRSVSLDLEECARDDPPRHVSRHQEANNNTSANRNNADAQVLESMTKDRPKGPVKRRPSTKRGREAIRNSCIDFSFMQNATTEDTENDTDEKISNAAQSFDREPRPHLITSSKRLIRQPQYPLISKAPTVSHTVLRQNIKEGYQVNFARLPKMTALATADHTSRSDLKSENQNIFSRADPPHSTNSETLNGRGTSVQSNYVHEHNNNKDQEATSTTDTEKLENIENIPSEKPPSQDRFEKFERWHEFKPHKVEHSVFTSECTVKLSRNPREVPKIIVDKSADPNITKFLNELITDRNSFDKAVKDGITETKTTTSVVRKTIFTNSTKDSETPSNDKKQFLSTLILDSRDDELDRDNTVLTSQTKDIVKDDNGSEIYVETLKNCKQESKNDVCDDGITTVTSVINTEDVLSVKIETSNNKPIPFDNDNELEANTKAKSTSPKFLMVDVENTQRPFDVIRRSSFVKTDNFASPEFIKEDLSEEEEEDVFCGKKLPPQSDIFKRSSIDDDDDDDDADLLVNKEHDEESKIRQRGASFSAVRRTT